MRTKTTTWLGLILMVTTLAAAPAAAQDEGYRWGGAWAGGEHPGMERFHEERFERVSAFLDLTDQQLKQWQEVFAARGEAGQGSRDEIRALHEEVRAMASADKPDATAIGELVIEAHRLMAAGEAEREAFHAELMSILTPDQRERFEALQELRPERTPRGGHGLHGLRHGGPGRGRS